MTRSKQVGTRFETSLLDELRLWYGQAERRALQGALDKGDFILPGEDRFILEAKCVSRTELAKWIGEAEVEARNAGVRAGVVVHKRRGNGKAAEQWATLKFGDLLYLVNTPRGQQ